MATTAKKTSSTKEKATKTKVKAEKKTTKTVKKITGEKQGTSTRFKKGVSGNPNGRPKRSQAEKDALEAIRKLAPRAAEIAGEMLEDPETPAKVRLGLIEMIFDRAYGKAYQAVQVTAEANTECGIIMMPRRGDHD